MELAPPPKSCAPSSLNPSPSGSSRTPSSSSTPFRSPLSANSTKSPSANNSPTGTGRNNPVPRLLSPAGARLAPSVAPHLGTIALPAVEPARWDVLECAHGEHTERNSKHTAEVRNQTPSCKTGRGFRPKLQLSYFRCRRILRCRPGEIARRISPGRAPSEVRPLHQA